MAASLGCCLRGHANRMPCGAVQGHEHFAAGQDGTARREVPVLTVHVRFGLRVERSRRTGKWPDFCQASDTSVVHSLPGAAEGGISSSLE